MGLSTENKDGDNYKENKNSIIFKAKQQLWKITAHQRLSSVVK